MMCILANFIIEIKLPDKKALENYIYNTYICYGYSNEQSHLKHMFKLMLIKITTLHSENVLIWISFTIVKFQ